MGIQIGDFTVEVTSIGTVGGRRFTGSWSIYRLPYSAGDEAVREGETQVFEDSGSALVRAENEGVAEARHLIAAEADKT